MQKSLKVSNPRPISKEVKPEEKLKTRPKSAAAEPIKAPKTPETLISPSVPRSPNILKPRISKSSNNLPNYNKVQEVALHQLMLRHPQSGSNAKNTTLYRAIYQAEHDIRTSPAHERRAAIMLALRSRPAKKYPTGFTVVQPSSSGVNHPSSSKSKDSEASGNSHSETRPTTTSMTTKKSQGTETKVKRPKTTEDQLLRPQTAPRTSKSSNAKAKTKPTIKTQVVLAPKFSPESYEPSVLTMVSEAAEDSQTLEKMSKSDEFSSKFIRKPVGLRSSSTNPFKSPSQEGIFPPVKAVWVQVALEKLGNTWFSSGVVPQFLQEFPDFQKKIGDLYDLAVDKKYNQILTQVDDVIEESTEYKRKVVAAGNCTECKKTSSRSNTKIPKKSLEEQEKTLQKQMSDILLQMVLKKLLPTKSSENVEAKESTTVRPKEDASKRLKKTGRKCSPNEQLDDGKADVIISGDDKSPDSTGIGVGLGDYDASYQSVIKQCYVSNGKMIEVPVEALHNKPINSFAPFEESRKRLQPKATGYFRRRANLKGFEEDEVSIKYSQTQIFVEGRQGQNGERNARLVREIIALPSEVQIEDLKVLRGRTGLMIFEEVKKNII